MEEVFLSWVLTDEYEFARWWDCGNRGHSGRGRMILECWPSATTCGWPHSSPYRSLSAGDPGAGACCTVFMAVP